MLKTLLKHCEKTTKTKKALVHALKHALGLVIIYLVGRGGGSGSENFGRVITKST